VTPPAGFRERELDECAIDNHQLIKLKSSYALKSVECGSEEHAMTAQPSSPFDFSPMLKTYMESVELCKKNYETMMKSAKDMQGASGTKEASPVKASTPAGASAQDAALLNWRKSGEEVFKRFVENQIELCQFFSSRWEQYLKLPEQLSQCRSLTELGNLQSSFLNQFANDYMHETEKLAHPVAELMTNLSNSKKT
jgi:hypothetical protein